MSNPTGPTYPASAILITTAAVRRATYARLVAGFRASAGQAPESRWDWLMAAHIVAQEAFGMHVHSHLLMLGFALRTADIAESAGQFGRLLLVPLGHFLGRLPAGNVGRATVSAFAPMPVSATHAGLIAQARRDTGLHQPA